ncbi:MAG: M48 family metalloprotease [Methylophilus sp.]|nr:M48 family metalloprotease [Methylophilus sp.]
MKRQNLQQLAMSLLLCTQVLLCPQVYADEGLLTNFGSLYSNMHLKFNLATTQNATPCEAAQCIQNKIFDDRVQSLGQVLAVQAYTMYPELEQRIPYFQFDVVDKAEAGMASNAGGRIVIFRGVQEMALTDEALQFVIAREMGHVIGQHHRKNSSTKLIIAALTTVFFPPAGAIIGASSTAAQASVAGTAVSSMTSYLGSEIAMLKVKPAQLLESDDIALNLMQDENQHMILNGLPNQPSAKNSWLRDLNTTIANLQSSVKKQDIAIAQVLP